MRKLFILMAVLWSYAAIAQTTVSGTVKDATTGDPIPGASIRILGTSLGTTSDFDGLFSLKVNEKPPFKLECSSIGFTSVTLDVKSDDEDLVFELSESAETLDEVVVSASRTPERIRESPVTIERIDAKIIQNAATPDFYDGLENLKGVDINTNSLTFKSVNTRGFATFANARFMQLVDGMDNTSPALNFVLGNLLGMNELDVNTVEILPGASSALYGANAFNGILFMTSKSPFDDQGISTYFKTGMTMQEVAGDNKFYDMGIRAAYKFSDKFAAKANFSFLKGTDWMTADYDQYDYVAADKPNAITPFADRGYAHNGLNIYGDEVAADFDLEQYALSNGFPSQYAEKFDNPNNPTGETKIGRTGYTERDLTDYKARSVKADFALHYKPWANDKEVVFNYRIGRGNTIYQGGNRYYIKDFIMDQMKLEFKGDNFFIRGYRTSEDAGDSYDMRFAGINMNKVNATQWFGSYIQNLLGAAYQQGLLTGMTPDQFEAAIPQFHAFARASADTAVTPQPGTDAFKTLFNQVVTDPDLLTGAKFSDNSKVHHVDGNYNLASLLDNWGDVQIGGSYRKYTLNSDGTIFTDYDGAINYNEYGAYTQISKKFADDRLKLTGSVRYDKAQNFDGAFSPRVAFVYSVGENLRHNIRASYQTGFRNPTTQDQYIGLDLGQAILVGSAQDNLDRYTSKPIPVSTSTQVPGYPYGSQIVGADNVILSGRIAYENAFTYSSLLAFAATGDPSLLKKSDAGYVQPEKVSAYELGYRGKAGSVNIDVSGYFNQYEGFIATKTVVAPLYGEIGNADNVAVIALANGDFQPFQIYSNSNADISSYGGTLGLSTKVSKFDIGLNYTYAKLSFDQATDPDYEAGFNTPEHKVKFNFGADELFENFGFGVNVRWQDEFLWQASFVDGTVPARTVIDAQINYEVPSIKSVFKVGGANLGGKDYIVAPGTGKIGQQYFASWTINP